MRPGAGAIDHALGFAGTREQALAIWEAAASRWAGTARRPTPGDIEVYSRLSGARLSGRVLILGVTPELRDLVADAGGAPVIVDMSAAMHEATSAMLRHADPAKERWIEADWCEAGLPAGEFDLVLGDSIWWAISVARQHELCNVIHTALDRDGLFVGRIRVGEPARVSADPVQAVSAHIGRLDQPGADRDEIETELLSWLYDHTADYEGRRLNRAGTVALLHKLANAPQFDRQAVFLRRAATRMLGADWTYQTREELTSLFLTRFDLIAEDRARDYDARQHPILAMRRRQL